MIIYEVIYIYLNENLKARHFTIFLVAVWSGVNVGGVRLREVKPELGTDQDPEKWGQIHTDVINRYFVYLMFYT